VGTVGWDKQKCTYLTVSRRHDRGTSSGEPPGFGIKEDDFASMDTELAATVHSSPPLRDLPRSAQDSGLLVAPHELHLLADGQHTTKEIPCSSSAASYIALLVGICAKFSTSE